MRASVVVAVLAFAALSLAYRNVEIERIVNSDPGSTWVAGHNAVFDDLAMEDIKAMCGTIVKPWEPTNEGAQLDGDYPSSFESQAQWSMCPSIWFIRNQAECGSCWAFSATEAFTDRWCIVNNGTQQPIFSPQYLTTCSTQNDGCEGGSPNLAWAFFKTSGTITDICQPYTIPTCAPSQQPCLSFQPTPKCSQKCVNSTGTMTKYYVSDTYQVGGYSKGSAAAIAQEISTKGPVQAAFTVYEDFLSYKSGVYVHKTGKAVGGHAVKLIGYGTLNGTPYWNVANSWTTYWGDAGFFMILRGSNECGIEDDVWAGTPKTN